MAVSAWVVVQPGCGMQVVLDYATFNVADVWIFLGVALLLVAALKQEGDRTQSAA